jgi:hypothetical protein
MSLAKRQAFTLIKSAYAKLNRKPVTTPSTLRLIVPLTPNRTSYSFPILEGDSNLTHPNQILLNRADAFTASSVGIFVGGLGGNPLAILPSADLGNEQLLQVPESFSAITGLRPYSIFNNGKLNIAVNNVQYLQNFDVFSMNKGTNIDILGAPQAITNGMYGERDGFTDLVPTLQFSGTSKIDITLNTPIAPYTGTGQLYLEIIFRGFLSLGASNLNK